MMALSEHRPSAFVDGSVTCSCGWGYADDGYTYPDDAILEFAKHYALEMQADKPRVRRGGVDLSEPTSKSHLHAIEVLRLHGSFWVSAHAVWSDQVQLRGRQYSPQRIRTCLAGLVRAGIVEERRPGRVRQYRLKDSSATAGE